MVNGADASSIVTSAQMRAMGLSFVGRYFSQFPSKNLTRGEVVDLGNARFDIFSIYEDDINDFARGYNGGVDNARRYLSQAAALGVPLNRPCYFAVDTDVNPNDIRLHDYFRGISDTLGAMRRGCYGSTGVLRALKNAELIDFTFRTMSIGWNGGAGEPGEFSIVQNGYINNAFDRDATATSDFGEWRFNWTPQMPAPEPVVHLWIIDMCAREDRTRPAGQTTNSAQVEIVQNALMAESWIDGGTCLHKTGFVPGRWDTPTNGAYARWQQKCGYKSGTPAADGIPGMTTLSKLGATHGFHVVS